MSKHIIRWSVLPCGSVQQLRALSGENARASDVPYIIYIEYDRPCINWPRCHHRCSAMRTMIFHLRQFMFGHHLAAISAKQTNRSNRQTGNSSSLCRDWNEFHSLSTVQPFSSASKSNLIKQRKHTRHKNASNLSMCAMRTNDKHKNGTTPRRTHGRVYSTRLF